jgi:hypothetical protein
VLYVADNYDISNQVLEMLGVKPGAAPEGGINPNAGEGRQKSAAGQQEKQRRAPPAAERKERM